MSDELRVTYSEWRSETDRIADLFAGMKPGDALVLGRKFAAGELVTPEAIRAALLEMTREDRANAQASR